MIDIILQPWSWYTSGFLIAITLFFFFFFGKNFGISSNLETFCTMAGAGKFSDYFKTNWKERTWSLIFLIGLILGGFIASNYLSATTSINLNPKTVLDLQELGFANAGSSFVPPEIFSVEKIFTFKGISVLLIAGFCIGFGTRYAGGCTSGHAITGLSSLQLPSLLAVIGFFIGGLIMTWGIFPLIFG
jgi:uncharacterized membrane protein YedE/YeeE